jgi:hypothetical protein
LPMRISILMISMRRDEFPLGVRRAVANRVGQHCSNPGCRKLTSGPSADPSRAVNMGRAAHITAAAKGGPRFDLLLTTQERCSIDNAIWLCVGCASLIDADDKCYTTALLHEWKQRAEDAAAQALRADLRYRPIAATEVRLDLSVAEMVAFCELEQELGCHVEKDVQVAAGGGWLRLHGAVVRDEDLIGIDIREHHGSGIAYFQIEHLLDLCAKLRFERFRKCAVYLVVVSDGPQESDLAVRAKLEDLLAASGLEGQVRMLRLNELRAKFGL